jgi:tetratricopeptide (TPR) repeat protein
MRVLGLLFLLGCSAEHHAEKGDEALELHDLTTAEASYRKALDKDPMHLPALEGLAWTYYLADQRGAAITAFSRCRELDPDRLGCIRGMASIALGEGEVGRARDLLGHALSLSPEDPGVQSSQALLEIRSGDLDQAEERYQSLVRRFPEQAEYLLGLAEVQLRKGQSGQSLESLDQARTLASVPVRYRARLHVLRARVLVAESAGRVDPEKCSDTAPPVLEWLDAADASLAQAESTGVNPPDLPAAKRLILRRRGVVEDKCPPSSPSLDLRGL